MNTAELAKRYKMTLKMYGLSLNSELMKSGVANAGTISNAVSQCPSMMRPKVACFLEPPRADRWDEWFYGALEEGVHYVNASAGVDRCIGADQVTAAGLYRGSRKQVRAVAFTTCSCKRTSGRDKQSIVCISF